MKIINSISCVDSHTEGEPTRIIVEGVGPIPGKTMPEKLAYFKKNLDHIRSGLMNEPRGHNDMFGAVITEPTTAAADFGVIFIEAAGYLNMCGHGTIGSVTVALETGIVEMQYPTTKVSIDTPAGFIEAIAECENGHVKSVAITNVPSFLYLKDEVVNIDGKDIRVDISFGGSFFAIVHQKELGLEIDITNLNALRYYAQAIEDACNEKFKIAHPNLSHIHTVDLVEIYGEPKSEGADAQNVVIFAQGSVDRSPCGTGTSAKMAMMQAKGLLKEQTPFVYESIIHSTFTGQVLGTTQVGEFEAIIPQVKGCAHITGYNTMVFDEADPFVHGFKI